MINMLIGVLRRSCTFAPARLSLARSFASKNTDQSESVAKDSADGKYTAELDNELPYYSKHKKAAFLSKLDFPEVIQPVILKLKEIGLTRPMLDFLTKVHPSVLTKSKNREARTDVLELIDFVQNKLGITDNKSIRTIIMRFPTITDLTISQIENLLLNAKDELKLDEVA